MKSGKEASSIRMRDAALIQLGSKCISVAVQLFVTAVLARLIPPEEFGRLAIVSVFVVFFNMFSDMGVGAAIVQFRQLEEDDFGRLFGFSCILAIFLSGVFCLASVPISWIYGDGDLVPLCCLASLSLLASTLNMVPNGLMLRGKMFSSIGLRLVVATGASGAMGIAIALQGGGCYALVVQMISSAVIVLVWNFASNPVRRVSFRFAPTLRIVFSYSAYQFAFSLTNYFNRNLDNLLIGKAMGAESLGYYDKAYRLTTYPINAFSSVLASVIQPFMAEHQDDPDRIFSFWLDMTKLFSIAGAAVSAVFFCCSEEIVVILFGDQWFASVPLLQALSVSIYAQMLGNPSGAFFQSLGRTDLMFRCGLANSCITVVALIAGLAMGDIVVLAWLMAGAFCLQLAGMGYFLVYKGFGKRVSCMRRFLPEAFVGVVSAFVGVLAGMILPDAYTIQLVGKAIASCFVLLVLFWSIGDMKYLGKLVRR